WQCTEYDLETGKVLRKYPLHSPFQSSFIARHRLQVSPDGKLTGDMWAQYLLVWRTADGSVALNLSLDNGRYQAMVFSPDVKTVLAGDDQHTIHVIDVASGKTLRTFGLANVHGVGAMALSPDGKWFATASGDGFFRLWNVEKGTEERTLDYPGDGYVGSFFFTADGRTVVATLSDKMDKRHVVRTWDAATGK